MAASWDRVIALEAQISELQEVVGAQRIAIQELQLFVDTGTRHKYCTECFRYVRLFSSIYMEHPDPIGGRARCPNSLKPWRTP